MSKIIIHTEHNPEDNAMLQALYSRSADSVETHLERLKSVGSGKFMEQYYVGYGHNSIADCGFITIYLEGISMLAAKAIQDNPLYNGQESSSRYIDWSNQPFYNPYKDTEFEVDAAQVLADIREFYISQMEPVKAHLRTLHPSTTNDDKVYDKTINAKAFDILRGFLPCGATTNVAWTTSLRKAREHLDLLVLHPLAEVQNLAVDTYRELVKVYPSSFPARMEFDHKKYAYDLELDNFYSEFPKVFSADYFVNSRPSNVAVTMYDRGFSRNNSKIGANEGRPPKTILHKHNIDNRLTRFNIYTAIDFGSFRDLQRHRGGYCSMPIVDNVGGFHKWYTDALPESSQVLAETLFKKIETFLHKVIKPEKSSNTTVGVVEHICDKSYNFSHKMKNQYLLLMGTIVPVTLSYDLPQTVYVCELRTGQTVHPTLRDVTQKVALEVNKQLPELTLHANMAPDEFSVKRGKQDITAVNQGTPISITVANPQ